MEASGYSMNKRTFLVSDSGEFSEDSYKNNRSSADRSVDRTHMFMSTDVSAINAGVKLTNTNPALISNGILIQLCPSPNASLVVF